MATLPTVFRRGKRGFYSFRVQVDGVRKLCALRTQVKATALERAKTISENLRAGISGWDKFDVVRVQKDFALCSEIEAAYKAWAPGERPLYHVRLVNLQKLKQVVRVALGEAQDRDWSTVVLSADLVRQYQAKVVQAAIDAEDDVGTAKRTANSTLTQARSVFAHLEAFAKLKLPEVASFMAAPRLKLSENEKLAAFLPFTQAEVDKLQVEMARRREAGETGVWLTYLLMLHCGMRNEEVQHTKREWFDVRADGSVWVRIVHWPYYFPKASLGEVPVPPHVWAEVQRLVAEEPAAWVIPGATATDREDVCKRKINAAVQAVLPERTAYDLRKMAGSNYYAQTRDLMATARFLRHKSSKTSEQWYVSLINQLQPLKQITGR